MEGDNLTIVVDNAQADKQAASTIADTTLCLKKQI